MLHLVTCYIKCILINCQLQVLPQAYCMLNFKVICHCQFNCFNQHVVLKYEIKACTVDALTFLTVITEASGSGCQWRYTQCVCEVMYDCETATEKKCDNFYWKNYFVLFFL